MITVHDKQFELYLTEAEIQERVAAVAKRIDADYRDKNPLFICVLTGAFMFASDLVRNIDFDAEIEFTRFSSYSGMNSTGEVRELMSLRYDITGRDIIIIEDIVDTGITMSYVVPRLKELGANSVEICCLLMKPEKLQVPLDVKYCAMEIPSAFIVGYGLDYDERGRLYKDIYAVKEE